MSGSEDQRRREKAGVPPQIEFRSRVQIAREEIEAALSKELVRNAMGRWMIERDYEELKSELGLSHYEGRNWRGFHHHATLCIAAYGFLMLERLRGKKTPLDSQCLPCPKVSGRAGLHPMQRHNPPSIATARFPSRPRHRKNAPSVSLLRETVA